MTTRRWFYAFVSCFVAIIVSFHLVAPYTDPFYPVKYLYLIYGAYFLIVLTSFVKKHGCSKFNKYLGLTCILAYVTSEYWEVPTFVCVHLCWLLHLGWLGKYYAGSVNQIYLIVAFVLLVKYSKFSFNKRSITLLLIPFLVSAIVTILWPGWEHAVSTWLIARFACYICLGTAFLKYSRVESVGPTGSAV